MFYHICHLASFCRKSVVVNKQSKERKHSRNGGRKEKKCLKKEYFGPDLKQLRYGQDMEEKARNFFTEITGFKIAKSGLIIKPNQCWLACSPDGLFFDANGDLHAIEIKCPSSCRDDVINVPYLDEDGLLKKSHNIYTQIQLQMYCCGVNKCTLIVYSSVTMKIVEVFRDEDFLLNTVPKLEIIYYDEILPQLMLSSGFLI